MAGGEESGGVGDLGAGGVDGGKGIEQLQGAPGVDVDVAGAGSDDLEAVPDDGGGEGVVATRGGRGSGILAEANHAGIRAEIFEIAHFTRIDGAEIGSGGHAVGPRLGIGGQVRIVREEGRAPQVGTAGEAVADGILAVS